MTKQFSMSQYPCTLDSDVLDRQPRIQVSCDKTWLLNLNVVYQLFMLERIKKNHYTILRKEGINTKPPTQLKQYKPEISQNLLHRDLHRLTSVDVYILAAVRPLMEDDH